MEPKRLIVDLLSDTHNQHGKFDCPGGDILLHSGDFTGRGTPQEVEQFMLWMEMQDYSHKVVIPGNHDWDLEKNFSFWQKKFAEKGIHLLNDSGVTLIGKYDDGTDYSINVWGSPVQPWFHSWAFNRHINEKNANKLHPWIKPHWDMVPEGTEILLTHGPAHMILDKVARGDFNVGCPHLAKRIEELGIALHVCGHIHEASGFEYAPKTTYVNASSLDLNYYAPKGSKPVRAYREIFQDGSIGYVL